MLAQELTLSLTNVLLLSMPCGECI